MMMQRWRKWEMLQMKRVILQPFRTKEKSFFLLCNKSLYTQIINLLDYRNCDKAVEWSTHNGEIGFVIDVYPIIAKLDTKRGNL